MTHAAELVMCTVLIVTRCKSNIVYSDQSKWDRVGDVHCVNCDNVSKVLALYVTLCITTEV